MGSSRITFGDSVHECLESETILDSLIRHKREIPYACKRGNCHSCTLRCVSGLPPEGSQKGLKDTLRLEGYFLPCLCYPSQDMEITLPSVEHLFAPATVICKEFLTPKICRLVLEPATPLYYHPGQFINIRCKDGLERSYSLASNPREDQHLELHIRLRNGGLMSTWIFEELCVGTPIDIKGPFGKCFYVPGREQQDLLLIGTGTGLAPLLGIVRDALYSGHSGKIYLYHGSRHLAGLYFQDRMSELAQTYPQFQYFPSLSGNCVPTGYHAGRAHEVCLYSSSPIKYLAIVFMRGTSHGEGGPKNCLSFRGENFRYLCGPIRIKRVAKKG